jgi:hypothetical protein
MVWGWTTSILEKCEKKVTGVIPGILQTGDNSSFTIYFAIFAALPVA